MRIAHCAFSKWNWFHMQNSVKLTCCTVWNIVAEAKRAQILHFSLNTHSSLFFPVHLDLFILWFCMKSIKLKIQLPLFTDLRFLTWWALRCSNGQHLLRYTYLTLLIHRLWQWLSNPHTRIPKHECGLDSITQIVKRWLAFKFNISTGANLWIFYQHRVLVRRHSFKSFLLQIF